MHATVSYDDGWVRVKFDERLPREEFRQLMRDIPLRWKRAEQGLAGPWTPEIEDTLKDKYGVELVEEEVDLLEMAMTRAEYYAGWSAGAMVRAEGRQKTADATVGNIPLGQPILVGHYSEKRHRADLEKAQRNMAKSAEDYELADKWAHRAEDTVARARRRYSAGALTTRIGYFERDIRKWEKRREELAKIRSEVKEDDAERLEKLEKGRVRIERVIEFFGKRLAVARALLAEAEDAAGDDVRSSIEARRALPIEVGGGVSDSYPDGEYSDLGWLEVVKINPKTVTVKWWLGVESLTYRLPKTEIVQAIPAEEWAKLEKTPYGGALKIVR